MESSKDHQVDPGPKSLNPRSPGCIAAGLVLVALVAAGIFFSKTLTAKTGEWAITAARKGLEETGLPGGELAEIQSTLDRLEALHADEKVGPQQVVEGVRALLGTRTLPLFVLADARERVLPRSNLPDSEKASGDATLAALLIAFDAEALDYEALGVILGADPEKKWSPELEALSADELRALLARAEGQLDGFKPAADATAPGKAELGERFRVAVDAAIVDGALAVPD